MNRLLLVLIAIVTTLCTKASITETVVLKDGTSYTGYVLKQNVGSDIVFVEAATEVVVMMRDVLSAPYRNEVERGSDLYYIDIYMKEPEGMIIRNVLQIERTPDYIKYKPSNNGGAKKHTISLNEVEKLTKEYSPTLMNGLQDELELKDGRSYNGIITSNVLGRRITITNDVGSYTFDVDEILSQRKVAGDKQRTVVEQAEMYDSVTFDDGQVIKGVIVEKNYRYGTITLFTTQGKRIERKISDITSISKEEK